MSSPLLTLRKHRKAKKPHFVKQDVHKKKRMSVKWRRPRGIDSKIRLKKRGYRVKVTKGWKAPRAVRGYHHSGMIGKVISQVAALATLDKEKEGMIVSKTVGKRKKVLLLEEAKKMGVTVLNVKDIDAFLQGVAQELQKKKEAKKKIKVKEEKKAKEQVEEKKEGKLADKVLTEEEKKVAEKKDKDKILTQKGV